MEYQTLHSVITHRSYYKIGQRQGESLYFSCAKPVSTTKTKFVVRFCLVKDKEHEYGTLQHLLPRGVTTMRDEEDNIIQAIFLNKIEIPIYSIFLATTELKQKLLVDLEPVNKLAVWLKDLMILENFKSIFQVEALKELILYSLFKYEPDVPEKHIVSIFKLPYLQNHPTVYLEDYSAKYKDFSIDDHYGNEY